MAAFLMWKREMRSSMVVQVMALVLCMASTHGMGWTMAQGWDGSLTRARRLDTIYDIEDVLTLHNMERELYYPGNKLSWDASLEDFAAMWAANLSATCQGLAYSGGPYGENVYGGFYMGSYNPFSSSMAVNAWIEEKVDYDEDSNSCINDRICEDYTQLIWKDTTKVGCSMSVCTEFEAEFFKGSAFYLVCEYSPKGNVEGERPFPVASRGEAPAPSPSIPEEAPAPLPPSPSPPLSSPPSSPHPPPRKPPSSPPPAPPRPPLSPRPPAPPPPPSMELLIPKKTTPPPIKSVPPTKPSLPLTKPPPLRRMPPPPYKPTRPSPLSSPPPIVSRSPPPRYPPPVRVATPPSVSKSPPAPAASFAPKSPPPVSSKPLPSKPPSFSLEASLFLDLHNRQRSTLYKNANLAWNTTLQASAQAWADEQAARCIFKADYSNNPINGENVFVGGWFPQNSPNPFKAYNATETWLEGKANYNYGINACLTGTNCQDYLVVIWKATTQLGCGSAICRNFKANGMTWAIWYAVCHYYVPAKPFVARPY